MCCGGGLRRDNGIGAAGATALATAILRDPELRLTELYGVQLNRFVELLPLPLKDPLVDTGGWTNERILKFLRARCDDGIEAGTAAAAAADAAPTLETGTTIAAASAPQPSAGASDASAGPGVPPIVSEAPSPPRTVAADSGHDFAAPLSLAPARPEAAAATTPYAEFSELPFEETLYEQLLMFWCEPHGASLHAESMTRQGTIRQSVKRRLLPARITRFGKLQERLEWHRKRGEHDEALLILRQLQYFMRFPPSLGGARPPWHHCIAPDVVDLSDESADDLNGDGDGLPLEAALPPEAPEEVAVIDVENFILDLNLRVVKNESEVA